MTEALDLPADVLPVLVLAHDGIDPGWLAVLETVIPGLNLSDEGGEILQALAQSWTTLDNYGPIKGHRESGNATDPGHPWYGVEKTDPERLLQRLGVTILTHAVPVSDNTRVQAIVTRNVFWTDEEVRAFCGFILAALPQARLLLPVCSPDQAEHVFVDRTGWRPDAARNAVEIMAGHVDTLVQAFPDRAFRWDLEGDAPVPADIVAALSMSDENGDGI